MNPFAAQGAWLDRRRAESLRDLEGLQAQLDDVAILPLEERSAALNRIILAADGAYRQIERIDKLRKEWIHCGMPGKPSPHWQLSNRIVTKALELRLAA